MIEKRIAALEPGEREKVKHNIEIVTNIFDSNSKVLAVNSNKAISDGTGQGGQKKSGVVDKAAIKAVNKNYKTKPCMKYHSDAGCGRGEACHFIHDKEYKGRPVPEVEKPSRGGNRPSNGQSYGGQSGYNDKPRGSGSFGNSNSQYNQMQGGTSGMYGSNMVSGYNLGSMNTNFSMPVHENSSMYPGMYKPGPNFPVSNIKHDKPGGPPINGMIQPNPNAYNYPRMMNPPVQPMPPRR